MNLCVSCALDIKEIGLTVKLKDCATEEPEPPFLQKESFDEGEDDEEEAENTLQMLDEEEKRLKERIVPLERREKKIGSFFKGLAIIVFITFVICAFGMDKNEEPGIDIAAGICVIILLLEPVVYGAVFAFVESADPLKKRLRQIQEERKFFEIEKTKIVGTSVVKDKDDIIARGIIGDFIGGDSGAIVGAATAKDIKTTSFLILYKSGTKEIKEVINDSVPYNEYVKYLEI